MGLKAGQHVSQKNEWGPIFFYFKTHQLSLLQPGKDTILQVRKTCRVSSSARWAAEYNVRLINPERKYESNVEHDIVPRHFRPSPPGCFELLCQGLLFFFPRASKQCLQSSAESARHTWVILLQTFDTALQTLFNSDIKTLPVPGLSHFWVGTAHHALLPGGFVIWTND